MTNDECLTGLAPFTDRCLRVIESAQCAARRHRHEHIHTDHLLLALLQEDRCIALAALRNLGADLQAIRHAVGKLFPPPEYAPMPENAQPTRRARHAVAFAMEEAQALHHPCVGTGHLLLGLLRERESVAAGILRSCGVELEAVRAEILAIHPAGTAAPGAGTLESLPAGGAWHMRRLWP